MADTSLCLSISDINVSIAHAPVRADGASGAYGRFEPWPPHGREAAPKTGALPPVIEEDIARLADAEFQFRAAS